MPIIFYLLPVLGGLVLLGAALQARWIIQQNPGGGKMVAISLRIAQGASTFLREEYSAILVFIATAVPLLTILSLSSRYTHPLVVGTFIVGAMFSALAGWAGMRVATRSNVRTTQAGQESLSEAFKIAFAGGTVMGMSVTALALIGLGGLFIMLTHYFLSEGLTTTNRASLALVLEALAGFSLGAESIALFSRVAGGIYTKAADVGADIVGKIEKNIPEDDPRNPATIADNVGDNVGDIAGMGADLFGSYVATTLAAMVLGSEIITSDTVEGLSPVLIPMLIGACGIIASLMAIYFTRPQEDTNIQQLLNRSNWVAILLTGLAASWVIPQLLPTHMSLRGLAFSSMDVLYATLIGLSVGALISNLTEYFTAIGYRPVSFIVRQSLTGHATNVIAGLSVGLMSTALPTILFAMGIYSSAYFAGFYGIAMAAVGMMATTTIQLSIDAFGPIADNAGGIAEMAGLSNEVRQRTDILDSVGNTTAAAGKGFAIGSAALTSLALFAAYARTAHIHTIDIYQPPVMAGLLIGAMVPFLFSALTISAVGEAAMAMVQEVRKQFNEVQDILTGKVDPDYDRCIHIATRAALRAMWLPGAIAILVPIIIGFLLGAEVLGGFLAGLTVSGTLLALFQSNAGGAWDNAKKSFEKGVTIEGEIFYKGSSAHKAAVTGDTVGDPLKDTSGPSMNILIKLSSIVALVIAPHIANKPTTTTPEHTVTTWETQQ